MHAIQIFDVDHYRSFHFEESFKKIYRNSLAGDQLMYTRTGYFAVPLDCLITNNMKQRFRFIEHKLLYKHGIAIGKINEIDNILIAPISNQFTYELINEECIWIRSFLDVIAAHLNSREAEGTKLTNHNNIRILIGRVVQSLEEVEGLINSFDSLSEHHSEYITECIQRACNYLAKLAGGRAFISNSIVEMMCVFELVNHLYLLVKGGDDASWN